MERELIRKKLFGYFRRQLELQSKGQRLQLQLGGGMMNEFEGSFDAHQRELAESQVLDVVHEFIRNGWLHHGISMSGSNSHLPWITITEYGKEVFLSEDEIPIDSDGYIAYFKKRIPEVNPITLQYLNESISAYHRRHLLSATLMLGVASEVEIIDLIDAYIDWLPESKANKLKQRTNKRTISTKYEEYKKSLSSHLADLPDEIKEEWETYLDGIFQFIRLNRNSAGHPTGKQFEPRTVFANIQVFCDYAEFIHKMIKFFQN
jgi:hypothetical protein